MGREGEEGGRGGRGGRVGREGEEGGVRRRKRAVNTVLFSYVHVQLVTFPVIKRNSVHPLPYLQKIIM